MPIKGLQPPEEISVNWLSLTNILLFPYQSEQDVKPFSVV